MIRHLNRSRALKCMLAGLLGAVLLAGCGTRQFVDEAPASPARVAPPTMASPAREAPAALGTRWGEGVESRSFTVDARKINPDRPDDTATLAYNDATNLRRTVGFRPEQRLNMQLADGNVEWTVLDENRRAIPLQRERNGTGMFRFAGTEGQRYFLRFRNLSDRRYSVVATVDGLNVVNGKAGSLDGASHVLDPAESLVIEGFRKSQSEVAAFRFAAPGRAYAANSDAGDARNIGVIGAALFELEQTGRLPRRAAALARPNAFPADNAYAPPPRYGNQVR